MSSPENPQVTSVEFNKFPIPEINLDTSEQEILQAVDEYLSELGYLVPPVERILDINTLNEDLKKVRKNQLAQRKSIVQNFKEQLNNKRLGMACCRMLVEGLIDQDPNIRLTTILEIIVKFAINYGVSITEFREMTKSLELFEKNRETTYAMRNHYQIDAELFEAISGIKEGNIAEVRIFTTPYGFLVHLSRKIASKIAFLNGYLFLNGVSITYAHGRIAFVFTDDMSESEIKRVSKHEIIHSKTDFFHPINFSYDYGKELTELNKFQRPSLKEWENSLVRAYQDSNTMFLVELISSADYLEARIPDYFINNYSIFSKSEFIRYAMRVLLSQIAQNLREAPLFSARFEHWKNKSDETLKIAYKAFLRLSKKKGLSRDEAVAFLSYLPLEMWQKAVDRLDTEEVRKQRLTLKRILKRLEGKQTKID